jgi:hypothetical protein
MAENTKRVEYGSRKRELQAIFATEGTDYIWTAKELVARGVAPHRASIDLANQTRAGVLRRIEPGRYVLNTSGGEAAKRASSACDGAVVVLGELDGCRVFRDLASNELWIARRLLSPGA